MKALLIILALASCGRKNNTVEYCDQIRHNRFACVQRMTWNYGHNYAIYKCNNENPMPVECRR